MIRSTLLRGAWLMLGAAIGIAAAILGAVAAVTVTGGGDLRDGLGPGLLAVLVIAVAVGLLPGVREIEVTAARSLLGVTAALTPEVRGWTQRWRTAGWTVVHAATGLWSGFCVFGMLPGGVVTLWLLAVGRRDRLAAVGLDGSWWVALLAGSAMLLATVVGPLLAGVIAVRLAPLLLGPTAADQLALVEQRLAAERRHTALARELHDGIGHALSIISIQAAAAHRLGSSRPERTDAALTVIEQTSRGAQAELDHLLGLLRDPDAVATRATRDDLPTLLQRHRDAGLRVDLTDDHGPVPPLVWHALLDVLAEALTNAHRHGTDTAVTVAIDQRAGELRLRVTNAVSGASRPGPARTGGRGVIGMRERADLVGGTVQAGPVDGHWQVVAVLPVPDVDGAAPSDDEETRR